ncbi:transposable element Tcb2 transposase [Trichonephila clavipes]|nr:transposable element Tcb2 transposase [Trichonephila clavipes]
MANNQSVRRHLDAFTRGRIIGKLEEGRSVTSVAAEFGIAHSIVSRLRRQFQTTGTAIQGFSSGRPRGTTPAGDRYIVLQKTARWWSVCTTPCTVCTFNACPSEKAFSVVPGTPELRDNEWGRVLFTDVSRFSLSSDSHHILVWREGESRNHPSNIIERDRGAMGLQFLFMDDNAPCHRTVAAEQLLESENIERMDWPARSPDLNPIEHVWNFLGRRLAARTLPPVTIRELRLVLQDDWAVMPQQLIDTLILSMGRRCETCLAVRGDHFPTKDRMFLAGHPSQGCFGLQSHFALHATFSIKLLFIPLISLLVSVAYITHVLTYWGSYGIKCVDLESFLYKVILKKPSRP